MGQNWDQSAFDEALERYVFYTSRTTAQILNTKAYYVARRACWLTEKADATRIQAELGTIAFSTRTTKSGRTVRGERILAPAIYGDTSESRALQILVARWRKKGGWPSGAAGIDEAVQRFVGARLRSVAYIKSGWIAAIRRLEPYAKDKGSASPIDSAAKQIGSIEKGDAMPATESILRVTIINEAYARHDTKGWFQIVAGRGLNLAFFTEAQDMIDWMAKQMSDEATRINAAL